jgi:adenine/guanine phosphoribosyltransferase-like PRPP-binding protein
MAYLTVAEAYMLIFGAAVACTTGLTFIEVRRMRKLTEKNKEQRS